MKIGCASHLAAKLFQLPSYKLLPFIHGTWNMQSIHFDTRMRSASESIQRSVSNEHPQLNIWNSSRNFWLFSVGMAKVCIVYVMCVWPEWKTTKHIITYESTYFNSFKVNLVNDNHIACCCPSLPTAIHEYSFSFSRAAPPTTAIHWNTRTHIHIEYYNVLLYAFVVFQRNYGVAVCCIRVESFCSA